MNKVFLVAGGSGGHLFPALSVSEQLKNYDTLILTDKRTEKYLKKLGMKYKRIFTARLKINFFLIFNLLKLFLSILDNIVIILKGKPDIEVLGINQRLSNINEIFDITTKPLIMDVDTGGKLEHFEINVKTIQNSGVSALIVEDKKGLKKNSLFGLDVKQEQDSIKAFSKKIQIGKKVSNSEFMVIARVESLILNKTVSDAFKRAKAYISAGADGIMIHSKQKTPKEIFQFSKIFKKKFPNVPLIAVPSSYNKVTEKQLMDNGFNVVIYANHLLRASYPAMKKPLQVY